MLQQTLFNILWDALNLEDQNADIRANVQNKCKHVHSNSRAHLQHILV